MKAEPYPPVLEYLVQKIETLIKESFEPRDIPRGWHLNTCLINYYGNQIQEDGKRLDCARVGEHKDFEPWPCRFDFIRGKGSVSICFQSRNRIQIQRRFAAMA